jgi:hypothetical protein
MTTIQHIGIYTINISFALHFVVYIPQIIHNRKHKQNMEISPLTQCAMLIAYGSNVIFGITHNMPWQYATISLVLLLPTLFQQYQMYLSKSYKVAWHIFAIAWTVVIIAVISIYIMNDSLPISFNSWFQKITYQTVNIASIIYMVYWLPQIYRNFKNKTANGFAMIFLYIGLVEAVLNTFTAIAYKYPIISLITGIEVGIMLIIVMFQHYLYNVRPRVTS